MCAISAVPITPGPPRGDRRSSGRRGRRDRRRGGRDAGQPQRDHDRGFHRSPLDEVARRADVARATVYHRFGSKLGLLEAVLSDFEHRADLPALAAVVHEGQAPTLLRDMVTEGCRYWSTDPALARKIIAAGAADPAAGELLRRRDAGRLSLLEATVRRLDVAGRLTLPPGPALDVLWVLTAFESYDQLAAGRGLSTQDTADVLAGLAEARLGG